MKLSAEQHIRIVIQQNLFILLSLFVLLAVIIPSVIILFSKYQEFGNRIQETSQEIQELKQKTNVVAVAHSLQNEGLDLDQLNTAFSTLIPNEEDFFSIALALEKLSSQTNFVISSYTILLEKSKDNKLTIQIAGNGDEESFIHFLKEYRFSGGRLMTINQIDFKKNTSTINVSINFHTGKSSTSSTASLTENEKKLMREVLDKVSIELKSPEDSFEYPTKNEPF